MLPQHKTALKIPRIYAYCIVFMFLEKIKPMISEKFGIDEAQITADTRIIEDLGADSLDLVDMLTIIEDDFNIVIPDEAAMNMRTVGDVVDYMQKASEK